MTRPTRVLVVEDSSTQRAQLRFILEEAGFEVLAAADGDEALDLARSHPLDIVVSDVVMPRLDGFKLCERIRADHRIGNLPVILLTAMTDPLDVLQALEAGADGFVRKPYDPEQLLARLGMVLATASRRSLAPDESGLTIRVDGREHYLSQERLQFLEVLAASFDDTLELLPDAPPRDVSGIRILVAEDSPTEFARLRFSLEEAGATVTGVTSGRDALVALETGVFDLVVTDVVMPFLDGRALCRAIRADDRFRRMPVIVMSSLTGTSDVLAAIEAGATNFIAKPFDEAYLLAKVLSVTAGRLGRLPRSTADPIDLHYGGRHFAVAADRMQMLDLLVASYDHTVQQNAELRQVQDELQALNQVLEDRVMERTRELSLEIEERVLADARRVEVEAQLHASRRAEGIGALAGGIAHDFNNLLSVILGYTDMALERLPEDDPARHDLDEAVRAAERAAALTGQLLAFSRKQILVPVPLNLSDVTESLTSMLRRIVGEDVQLIERVAPDLG
ncbi:MAG: response regulator, partial [Chloroflexota bacterium]